MSAKDFLTRIIISAKDESAGVFSRVREGLSSVGGAIKLVAAAAVGLGSLFGAKLFGQSVREAEELDTQMRRLEGAIAATGGAARLTAEEISQFAEDLDEATLASAGEVREAAAQLLTFRSVAGETFKETLALAQDLAETGFGNISSNAVMLGKALEDPVRGMTALRRAGVSLTEEQQNLIRSLVDSNRLLDAQQVVLQAVAEQVEGVAEQAGAGLSGAIDLVKKRAQDLREQFGTVLLPVLTEFNTRLADLYGRLRDSGAMTRFGEVVASAMRSAADAFYSFVGSVDLDAVLEKVKAFAEQTRETLDRWGKRVQAIGDVVRLNFSAINMGLQAFQAAIFQAAGAISRALEVISKGFSKFYQGLAALSFGGVAEKFRALSSEWTSIAESFSASAEVNFGRAKDSLDAAAKAGEGVRETLARMVGVGETAAVSLDKVADSADRVSERVGLTADELDALGESASFAAEGEQSLIDANERLARSTEGLIANLAAEGTERAAQLQTLAAEARTRGDLVAALELESRATEEQERALQQLVDTRQAEMRTAEMRLRLEAQEGSLRVQRIRNLIAEAEARGDTARVQRLQIDLARAEAEGSRAIAEAARARATAAAAAAEAMRAQAEALHDTSAETLLAIEAAELHARSLGLEAEAAEEAARSLREMVSARRSAALATDEQAGKTERLARTQDQATESTKRSTSAWLDHAGAAREAGASIEAITNHMDTFNRLVSEKMSAVRYISGDVLANLQRQSVAWRNATRDAALHIEALARIEQQMRDLDRSTGGAASRTADLELRLLELQGTEEQVAAARLERDRQEIQLQIQKIELSERHAQARGEWSAEYQEEIRHLRRQLELVDAIHQAEQAREADRRKADAARDAERRKAEQERDAERRAATEQARAPAAQREPVAAAPSRRVELVIRGPAGVGQGLVDEDSVDQLLRALERSGAVAA